MQQGSGHAQQLTLPNRHVVASFSNHRVEARWKLAQHEVVQPNLPERLHQRGVTMFAHRI